MGRRMRIVCFIRLREHAICERRLNRSADDVRGHHSGHSLAPIRARKFERYFAGRQIGARNHRRDRIQNMLLRLFYDLWR